MAFGQRTPHDHATPNGFGRIVPGLDEGVCAQSFGFTVSDETEELGMSALVERQFSFALTNDGNGQDSFTIELLESGVPADWSVTPMMSTLTLNKGETRTQQFTVFAPASTPMTMQISHSPCT